VDLFSISAMKSIWSDQQIDEIFQKFTQNFGSFLKQEEHPKFWVKTPRILDAFQVSEILSHELHFV